MSLPASLLLLLASAATLAAQDADGDGLPDQQDSVPRVSYVPLFDARSCPPLDLDPSNNPTPQGMARERVARFLANESSPATRIAFAIVVDGSVHFADAFERLPNRSIRRDPQSIHRLFRVGSTTKPLVSVAAKILEEKRVLSFADFVDDADGTQKLSGGQVTLRQLLTHRGAFKRGDGHIYMYCFPGNLRAFWMVQDEFVSPRYGSSRFGNLAGGFEYSGFNYGLAGAYLEHKTGLAFDQVLQRYVFDRTRMATASLDAARAHKARIGGTVGTTKTSQMHVGPFVNLTAPTDPNAIDNYYSSNDVYGVSQYSQQSYRLDECAADARDPAGGVVASVIDLAHFARELIAAYHGRSALLTRAGLLDLWAPTHDYNCGSGCPYQRYYATGFFTGTPKGQPVVEVEHGGSRAGYNSVFVIRPEARTAISILVNANVDLLEMNRVGKRVLDDLGRSVVGAALPYGQACPGAGPTLTASTAPSLGRPLTIGLFGGAPSSAALLFLGVSRWTYAGLPLPLDLTGLGAPGCSLLASGEFLLPVPTNGFGFGSWGLAIPNANGFAGTSLFTQALVFDPRANAFGAAFSRGLELRIGRP